jgi:hypothetical protein
MKVEQTERGVEHPNDRLPADTLVRTKDTERQRIENELLRQRMIAISGPTVKKGMHSPKKSATDPTETHQSIHTIKSHTEESVHRHIPEPSQESVERKTIIRSKRSLIVSTPDSSGADDESPVEKKFPDKEKVNAALSERKIHGSNDGMNIGIRDQIFRAKDAVFEGKGVRRSSLPPARDSTLLHTDLKSKKTSDESPAGESDRIPGDNGPESNPQFKKRETPDEKDKGISWV